MLACLLSRLYFNLEAMLTRLFASGFLAVACLSEPLHMVFVFCSDCFAFGTQAQVSASDNLAKTGLNIFIDLSRVSAWCSLHMRSGGVIASF